MRFCFLSAALALVVLFFMSGCTALPPHPTDSRMVVMLIKVPKKKELQRVVITLRSDAAPQTVTNFKKLVEQHYYNGMRFHRVFPHSLVQTGDPKSRYGERDRTGTGGPGYTLPAEIRLPHIKGAVAASRLPDKINPLRSSNGSQFYVCLDPMPQLNGEYTVFGQVTEGLEILDAISTVQTNSNNFPMEKIVIQSIEIL